MAVKDEADKPIEKKRTLSERLSAKKSIDAEASNKLDYPNFSGEGSTLHPEKLSHARFSDRKRTLDDDGISIPRLLTYIVIVVVVGVALTLGAQAYFQSQASKSNNQNNTTPPPAQNSLAEYVKINNQAAQDSQANPVIVANDRFIQKDSTVGNKQTESATAWAGLAFDRFQSVERVTLDFTTAVNNPQTTIKYSSGAKVMYLEIPFIKHAAESIKPGVELLKLDSSATNTITSIQNSTVAEDKLRISIYFNESVRYFATFNQGDLVIDVRQADYVANGSPTSSPVVTPQPTPNPPPATATTGSLADVVAEAGRPAEPHTDNGYSKNTQYVASSYRGDDLRIWNYTYRDYGDRYEFKFRIKHSNGDTTTHRPNVKAYLNNNKSDPKLIIEVYNLSWEILNNYTKAECFDGVGFGNVEKICGKFNEKEKMVKYEVSLVRLADFEIDALDNTPYDSARGGDVLWVKIKDN